MKVIGFCFINISSTCRSKQIADFYSWGGLATTNAILHSVLVHHGYLSPLRATNSQFQSRGRSLMSVLQRNPLKKLAQNWRYPAVSSPSSSSVPPPPIALNELPLQTTYNDLLPSIRTHVFYHLRSCLWITYDCAIPSDRPFITPYTSTITPSSSYLSDPLNVYACLGMPKPFVHFLGLPLNGAVDSRIVDNYGRFLRVGVGLMLSSDLYCVVNRRKARRRRRRTKMMDRHWDLVYSPCETCKLARRLYWAGSGMRATWCIAYLRY
ncbi:hypothetical protein BDZ97DRAFT_489575 [Flammula alnicola]|nr:hypothetical protein BDZ97DRAFT_489575 [Flammula alnicola]